MRRRSCVANTRSARNARLHQTLPPRTRLRMPQRRRRLLCALTCSTSVTLAFMTSNFLNPISHIYSATEILPRYTIIYHFGWSFLELSSLLHPLITFYCLICHSKFWRPLTRPISGGPSVDFCSSRKSSCPIIYLFPSSSQLGTIRYIQAGSLHLQATQARS